MLLKAEGPEELATIAAAVDASFDQRSGASAGCAISASFWAVAAAREPGDLRRRLDPWIDDGEHAWLFDNDDDQLDLSSRILGFDMTALLENPRLRTPTMMYLFHRIDERLDGQPTIRS